MAWKNKTSNSADKTKKKKKKSGAYWVVLVQLDTVAGDEGRCASDVHPQQESIWPPKGQSGNKHGPYGDK